MSSAAIFAEMAAWLHEHGKSLHTKLFEIYEQLAPLKCFTVASQIFRYGFHLVRSTYWIVPNPQVTKDLFESLRKDLKVSELIFYKKKDQ